MTKQKEEAKLTKAYINGDSYQDLLYDVKKFFPEDDSVEWLKKIHQENFEKRKTRSHRDLKIAIGIWILVVILSYFEFATEVVIPLGTPALILLIFAWIPFFKTFIRVSKDNENFTSK